MAKIQFEQRRKGKVSQIIECEALNIAMTSSSELVLIELVGADTAVRAVWARLVRARMATASDTPDPSDIEVRLDGKWKEIKLFAKQRYVKKVDGDSTIVHVTGLEAKRIYIPGGDLLEPSPYFLDAFKKHFTTIPVLGEWEKDMWAKGLQAELIKPLAGVSENDQMFWEVVYPDNTYAGKNSDEHWKKIIKEIVWPDLQQ